MELFDTHCHIHEAAQRTTPVHDKWHEKGPVDIERMLADAREAGVGRMLCVGTTLTDSELAVEFVRDREGLWASIGIHPHEASEHTSESKKKQFSALLGGPLKRKISAVGECGLDYFYGLSPKEDQLAILKFQIELALEHDLPLSFHVREAFDDFWPVFESYKGVRGVLHSFTDSRENLDRALGYGLYIGVNGIATFAKQDSQLDVYRSIPLTSLLLETDAPFLTPVPYRGKICEPKHARVTAEFLSGLRGESLADIAEFTTANARKLLRI